MTCASCCACGTSGACCTSVCCPRAPSTIGAAIAINVLALLAPIPENCAIESVTDESLGPKMLERKRLPISISEDPEPPEIAEPILEVRLERALGVLAGLVTIPKIWLRKPGSSALDARPERIAAELACNPLCAVSVDTPRCEASGPTTCGPIKLMTLSMIEAAITLLLVVLR